MPAWVTEALPFKLIDLHILVVGYVTLLKDHLLLVVIHAFHIILRVLTLLFRNKAQLVILAQDKVQVGFGWNKGAKLKPWKTEAWWEGESALEAF